MTIHTLVLSYMTLVLHTVLPALYNIVCIILFISAFLSWSFGVLLMEIITLGKLFDVSPSLLLSPSLHSCSLLYLTPHPFMPVCPHSPHVDHCPQGLLVVQNPITAKVCMAMY